MKPKLVSCSIIVLLVIAPILGSAQTTSLYFNHLTVNNGLSQGVATVTLNDSRGFTWISTLDGIDRFDGISTKHYSLSHLSTVNLSQTTTNFLEDKNGDIWAGTQHGLLKYNYAKDAFSYLPLNTFGINNNYTSPDIVRIAYVDDRNRIWVQRENHFYVIDINTGKSTEIISNIKDQFPQAFFPYVIGPVTGDVFKLSMKNGNPVWEKKSLNISLPIKTSVITHDGTIFLAAGNKIYRYNFENNQLSLFNTVGEVTVLKENHGVLWAGTQDQGIIGFDINSGKIINSSTHLVYNNNSILSNTISSFYIDKADNLWVSVWGHGISFTNLNKFRMQHAFTRSEAEAQGCSNFIRCIAADSKGDIWCSTGENYLVRLNSQMQFKEKILFPGFFSHFIIDKNDDIWFGIGENIHTYSINTRKTTLTKRANKEETGAVNHISQLRDGSFLVSCNFGIWTIGRDGLFKPVDDVPRDKVVILTYENSKRELFIGIDRIGMIAYGKTFTFPGNVKCFYEQNDTVLWIATTAGLLLFNSKQQKVERIFTTNDGLPNNYLYACLPDAKGNLWISSNKGLTAFNLQNYQCRNFNIQDGIQSNEFNSFAYLLRPDSSMVFGGVNGLNVLQPSSFKEYSYPAKPQITSIKTDSLQNPFSFATNEPVVLPYYKSNIEIGIAALEYANAASNSLKYMLEGKDKDWTISSNKGLIQYAHLSPGRYKFKVMAANCDGIWSNEIKTLSIVVLNPFWLSWWFISGCILLIAAVLYLFYRFRLQQVVKIERLRMRLATDLHDDIGATLSSISMYSDAVKKQVKDQLPQLEPVLEKMGENSRKMVSSMSDIVWAVNPGNDLGIKLLEKMDSYAKDACSVTDTNLHFNCADEVHSMSFPLEYRKNIYLIFKEALTNALKYAGASDLWINIKKEGGRFSLLIKDNGKGFELNRDHDGNGLNNIRTRAKEINAELSINSVQNTGTTIELLCKIS